MQPKRYQHMRPPVSFSSSIQRLASSGQSVLEVMIVFSPSVPGKAPYAILSNGVIQVTILHELCDQHGLLPLQVKASDCVNFS